MLRLSAGQPLPHPALAYALVRPLDPPHMHPRGSCLPRMPTRREPELPTRATWAPHQRGRPERVDRHRRRWRTSAAYLRAAHTGGRGRSAPNNSPPLARWGSYHAWPDARARDRGTRPPPRATATRPAALASDRGSSRVSGLPGRGPTPQLRSDPGGLRPSPLRSTCWPPCGEPDTPLPAERAAGRGRPAKTSACRPRRQPEGGGRDPSPAVGVAAPPPPPLYASTTPCCRPTPLAAAS